MHDGATVFNDIASEVEIPPDGTLSRVLFQDEQLPHSVRAQEPSIMLLTMLPGG